MDAGVCIGEFLWITRNGESRMPQVVHRTSSNRCFLQSLPCMYTYLADPGVIHWNYDCALDFPKVADTPRRRPWPPKQQLCFLKTNKFVRLQGAPASSIPQSCIHIKLKEAGAVEVSNILINLHREEWKAKVSYFDPNIAFTDTLITLYISLPVLTGAVKRTELRGSIHKRWLRHCVQGVA